MSKTSFFVAFILCMTLAWSFSPLAAQQGDAEKEYAKAKLLLGDATRAGQAGGEASALEKYGEALILLRQITVKNPSWKQEELSASFLEAESGYIRTLTGIVVKLQNASMQGGEIANQQAEILGKINLITTKNAEIMKFLSENRDLIEKVSSSIGR